MKKYKVLIKRISYSSKEIEVEADSVENLNRLATAIAYTEDFEEQTAEYKIEYALDVNEKVNDKILWPHKCNATGKGMDSGFCFGDGIAYFISESDAEKYAKEIGYKSLKEAYDDGAYYWTEWYDDEPQYEELPDGTLIEIE